MDTDFAITTGDDGLLCQSFNGKEYKLYPKERYFSRGTKRMHVVVWEFFNGKRPPKHHVHHKDENTYNNRPNNLEAKKGRNHLSEHTRRRIKEDPEKFKAFQAAGIKAAPEWHRSEEGRKWHSDNAKNIGYAKNKTVDKICEQCSVPFATTNLCKNSARFCSNACKSAYRRGAGLDNIAKKCAECGNDFFASKYSAITSCSRICGSKIGNRTKRLRLNG